MSEAPGADELFYQRAIRRIYLHMLWIGIAGALVAAWQAGWATSLGFLIGAAVSVINFRWLHHLADSLESAASKPRKGLKLLLPLRYVLFGAAGYVIVKYFKVNILAALVGLFVAVAAVLVEILYELVYART